MRTLSARAENFQPQLARRIIRPLLTAALGLAITFTFSCSSGGDGDTCGGKLYDTGKYGCVNNELVGTCGDRYYNPEYQQCLNGDIQNGAEITLPSSSGSGGGNNQFNENSQIYNEDGSKYTGSGIIQTSFSMSTDENGFYSWDGLIAGSVTNGIVRLNLPQNIPNKYLEPLLSDESSCTDYPKDIKGTGSFALTNSNRDYLGRLEILYMDEYVQEGIDYWYLSKTGKVTCNITYKDGESEIINIDAKSGWNKVYFNENHAEKIRRYSTNNILTKKVNWIISDVPAKSSSSQPQVAISSSSSARSSSSVAVGSSSSANSSSSALGSSSSVVSSSSTPPSSSSVATYTVTYNANGGTGAPANQTKTHGVALTLSTAVPTRTGYTFASWNTSANGTGESYASGASYTDNAGVTLYAQWNQTGIINGTSVSYEGETYQTVVIGTQTWMARNLNYAADSSVCYNNDPANCATYGRLYDWTTAMALPDSCVSSECSLLINAKHRGICPSGWHIPSDAEWTTLTDYVGGSSTAGTKLKATSGWNSYSGVPAGTDSYGFSALPGGLGHSNGDFSGVGKFGFWWSATEYNAALAWFRRMGYLDADVYRDFNDKTYLLSVRCVQD